MKVDNHRLVISGTKKATFMKAGTNGGKLKGGKPRLVVIHYTAGGAGSGAVNWFARCNANSSAHLVIDHDGDITQMLDFNEVGWHAGGGARRWVGKLLMKRSFWPPWMRPAPLSKNTGSRRMTLWATTIFHRVVRLTPVPRSTWTGSENDTGFMHSHWLRPS